MLKNSDNLTTDSLLKKMGEIFYREADSWQNGRLRTLKKDISFHWYKFKDNLINDGVRLSSYNIIWLVLTNYLNFLFLLIIISEFEILY
ncbi:hypothetical protein [Coxiella-like endosymbiont]|uniref:hypothetical protein n=1 Tax=Coxiella-like endosymbiont TaxID=1592897 RepID=UPI00272CA722|nr:hypothetical protein [Coxiella-like endosymbiont]